MNIAAILYRVVAAQDASDGLGIAQMLVLKHPFRETLNGIVVVHRDRLLQNDHPMIDRFVDEVHRASRHLGAILQRLLDRKSVV